MLTIPMCSILGIFDIRRNPLQLRNLALKLSRDASDRTARQLFGYSILYLFVLFAVLIVDRAPGVLG